jgi:DNA-binding response OmpR family regulator
MIALTAQDLTVDRDRVLEAGCADFHAKPVEFPRLPTQIEAALSGKGPGP